MLFTHEHVATHHACEIYRRKPGFEFTPILLGKIASFLIRSPDSVSGAAFMYPLLFGLDGQVIDEAQLLDDALNVIVNLIDRGALAAWQDVTFEFRDGAWTPVSDPRWWISVLSDHPV